MSFNEMREHLKLDRNNQNDCKTDEEWFGLLHKGWFGSKVLKYVYQCMPK